MYVDYVRARLRKEEDTLTLTQTVIPGGKGGKRFHYSVTDRNTAHRERGEVGSLDMESLFEIVSPFP